MLQGERSNGAGIGEGQNARGRVTVAAENGVRWGVWRKMGAGSKTGKCDIGCAAAAAQKGSELSWKGEGAGGEVCRGEVGAAGGWVSRFGWGGVG